MLNKGVEGASPPPPPPQIYSEKKGGKGFKGEKDGECTQIRNLQRYC